MKILWYQRFNIIKKNEKNNYIVIYCYRDIELVISWYKILVSSPTPIHNYASLKALGKLILILIEQI